MNTGDGGNKIRAFGRKDETPRFAADVDTDAALDRMARASAYYSLLHVMVGWIGACRTLQRVCQADIPLDYAVPAFDATTGRYLVTGSGLRISISKEAFVDHMNDVVAQIVADMRQAYSDKQEATGLDFLEVLPSISGAYWLERHGMGGRTARGVTVDELA